MLVLLSPARVVCVAVLVQLPVLGQEWLLVLLRLPGSALMWVPAMVVLVLGARALPAVSYTHLTLPTILLV